MLLPSLGAGIYLWHEIFSINDMLTKKTDPPRVRRVQLIRWLAPVFALASV